MKFKISNLDIPISDIEDLVKEQIRNQFNRECTLYWKIQQGSTDPREPSTDSVTGVHITLEPEPSE